MQQVSGLSGVSDTYNENLTGLALYVKDNATNPNVKYAWHMTWAYAQNSTHEGFKNYNNSQREMYNAIVSCVQNNILPNENFDFIIPAGTAIQNARTSYVGDTLTTDGYHLEDLGKFIASLTYVLEITNWPLEDMDMNLIPQKFMPYIDVILESVTNALENPYEVTNSENKTNPRDNKVKSEYTIKNNTIVFGPNFNNLLSQGDTNKVVVTVENYLGFSETNTYYINALSSNVSINFASISSEVISSSRRIVINANAGIGEKLDKDYCWYYWSTNPNDSLKYEDFLINYARSEYKGSYSEDKGVILRNTAGTYYLYALAKDEDSYIVSRSEGYTLDDTGFYVSYSEYDAILVVSLLIIAIIPISIYLFIRKRGY
jgi:hypothetical protein